MKYMWFVLPQYFSSYVSLFLLFLLQNSVRTMSSQSSPFFMICCPGSASIGLNFRLSIRRKPGCKPWNRGDFSMICPEISRAISDLQQNECQVSVTQFPEQIKWYYWAELSSTFWPECKRKLIEQALGAHSFASLPQIVVKFRDVLHQLCWLILVSQVVENGWNAMLIPESNGVRVGQDRGEASLHQSE